MFKKIITAAASAAVVAGVLLAAPANATGVTINGGGSSFAAGAMKACAASYTANTVNYTTSSSTTGKASYKNSTFQYAASDSLFSASDVPSGDNGTHFVTVPLLGGPVVFAYSAVGVNDGLKLTPEVVSGIFKGTITRWDDAALKALNPKVKLPKKAIKVALRSSGSGTTANLTTYLYQTLNTAPTGSTNNSGWLNNNKDLVLAAGGSKGATTYQKDGNGNFVLDSNGDKIVIDTVASGFAPLSQTFATSQLLAAYVEDNSNVFGYFDLSDAITADVGIAALKNAAGAFVMPTASAAAKFIGAQSTSTQTAEYINGTLDIDFNKVVSGAYQLSIVTYGLAPKYSGAAGTKSTNATKLAVQDFFNYVVKTCIPAKAASLGYVALGGALKTSALNQIKLIG
jgi:phosphate transport system substrate-binding protein